MPFFGLFVALNMLKIFLKAQTCRILVQFKYHAF